MDFDIQAQREQSMEITRREMMRKSLDTMQIYNPLDTTFRFQWDSFWWSVPAKGTKDVPRYIAAHYFKKIADVLIGQQLLAKGEELKALREKQFGKTFNDKYEENIEVWNRVPKLDDIELRKQVADRVINGLVEEYGYDLPEELPTKGALIDFRSSDDQIFSKIDKRVSASEVSIE